MNRWLFMLIIGLVWLMGCKSAEPIVEIAEGGNPKLLQAPIQEFPRAMLAAEILKGKVVLEVLIGEEGSVLSSRVVEASHQGFVNAALNVASEAKFEPALSVEGDNIPVILLWPFYFDATKPYGIGHESD